jgi:hypothetical protein
MIIKKRRFSFTIASSHLNGCEKIIIVLFYFHWKKQYKTKCITNNTEKYPLYSLSHTHTHTHVGVPALYALYMQITGIVLRDYSGFSNFHYVLFKWTSKFCGYVEPIAAAATLARNKHSINSLQLHIIITLTTWSECVYTA